MTTEQMISWIENKVKEILGHEAYLKMRIAQVHKFYQLKLFYI